MQRRRSARRLPCLVLATRAILLIADRRPSVTHSLVARGEEREERLSGGWQRLHTRGRRPLPGAGSSSRVLVGWPVAQLDGAADPLVGSRGSWRELSPRDGLPRPRARPPLSTAGEADSRCSPLVASPDLCPRRMDVHSPRHSLHLNLIHGEEWAIFKLEEAVFVNHVEIETTYFKGNCPDNVKIEGTYINFNEDQKTSIWKTILNRTKLIPNQINGLKHPFIEVTQKPVNHIKVIIAPDGGLARIRIYGVHCNI